MTTMTSADRREKIWAVVRVASGNFLEMYDFFVFGYYATAIGRAFFPTGSEFAQLMLAFMTFGAGFLMRPLGGIFLGTYIDHYGRRAGLMLTLGLMAVGTITIALVPGYTTLGALAPVMVVIGRLIQGFSAGVELGGVSVYLAEIATPGHKGFYVRLAVRQPAGRGHLRRAPRRAAEQDHSSRVDAGVGLADSVSDRVSDHSAPVHPAALARGNRGVRATAPCEHPSQAAGNPAATRTELANRHHRHAAGDHDDGLVLLHHRLHSDLWSRGPQARQYRKPGCDAMRRHFEPVLAPGDGRGVRPNRPPARADRVHDVDVRDRLSGFVMAGQHAFLCQAARGRAVVLVHLCQLQRRDGGGLDRDRPAARAHGRFFRGLQSCDGAVRRLHPRRGHLSDPRDREPRCRRRVADVCCRVRPGGNAVGVPYRLGSQVEIRGSGSLDRAGPLRPPRPLPVWRHIFLASHFSLDTRNENLPEKHIYQNCAETPGRDTAPGFLLRGRDAPARRIR